MNLGEPARKAIKGHSLDFYLTALHDLAKFSPNSASATTSG